MATSARVGFENEPVSDVIAVRAFRDECLGVERRALRPLDAWHHDGRPVDECVVDFSALREQTKFERVERQLAEALVRALPPPPPPPPPPLTRSAGAAQATARRRAKARGRGVVRRRRQQHRRAASRPQQHRRPANGRQQHRRAGVGQRAGGQSRARGRRAGDVALSGAVGQRHSAAEQPRAVVGLARATDREREPCVDAARRTALGWHQCNDIDVSLAAALSA